MRLQVMVTAYISLRQFLRHPTPPWMGGCMTDVCVVCARRRDDQWIVHTRNVGTDTYTIQHPQKFVHKYEIFNITHIHGHIVFT